MALANDAFGEFLAILTKDAAERGDSTNYSGTVIPTTPHNSSGTPTSGGSVSAPSQISAEGGFTPPKVVYPLTIDYPGAPSNVKLLLHFDSIVGETVVDETGKVMTCNVAMTEVDNLRTGKFGKAVYMFGNCLIATGASSDFNFAAGNFTIHFWGFWPSGDPGEDFNTQISADTWVFNIRPYQTPFLTFTIYDTELNAYVVQLPVPATDFIYDALVHYAVTRNGAALSLWQNGFLMDTVDIGTATILEESTDFHLYQTAGYSHFYDEVLIDELVVVKGEALWVAPFTPPTTPSTAEAAEAPTPGIKTKCHFEIQSSDGGVLITKDETGRVWSQLPTGEDTVLASPGKFGTKASDGSPGSFVASSDFNFGTGDFCISQWGQVMAAWWQAMDIISFDVQVIYAYLESSGTLNNEGHYAVIDSPASVLASITWMVKDGYEVVWNDIPQSFFDDAYHMFTFSRKGDVFTLYVDGDPKAQETFAGLTMPYHSLWSYEFWFDTNKAT